MLDPLTALGVAGNVLQIIDFGFQLVADGNQIYHSATGALEVNKAADELAKDLESLTKRLSESQIEWTKSHGDIPLEPDEVHLRNICERCTEISIELQRQLQKLKRQDGGKRQRLKSYKQALISVWRKDQIDIIATRLARYQQELDTHILIGIRKSVQASEWKTSEQFASLERQTQQLTIAVLDGGGKIDSRLSDQAEVLARIYEQTSQILSTLESGYRSVSPLPTYQSTPGSLTTPLHEAAEAGELLKVKQLQRSATTDINAQDQDGCRPLHLANTAEVAKRLLGDRRVEKDAEDFQGRTPLHYAVLKRRLDFVKALLEAGVDSSIEDDTGRTANFYAQDCPAALWLLKYGHETEARAEDHLKNPGLLQMAWMGDKEGIEFFLRQGADVNARNVWFETALTEASRHGSIEIVEILVKAGANLELAAGNQWTPLLQAVRDNRIEVVRLLLKHGAMREPKLKNGNTPLAEACYRDHFEIAEILVEAGCNIDANSHLQESPLQRAVIADRHGLVEMLVKRKANVDYKGPEGLTAVYHAVDHGRTKLLKMLLESGANPSIFSDKGLTALGLSCKHGHYECGKLLLDYGADVNAYQTHESSLKYTSLGTAAHFGDTEIIELLLNYGARIESCSPTGFSALSIAAQEGQSAAIKLLVDHGANIEERGLGNRDPELDRTPLMLAARYGHSISVDLLLDLGAIVDVKDVYGRTALYYAAVNGHNEAVEVLIHAGANVNNQKDNGTTALMGAANKGYVEIVHRLLEANANTRLRDWRGCTAWTFAVLANHDRELEELLKPTPDEYDTLHRLQADRSPTEIAAYMNEVYH